MADLGPAAIGLIGVGVGSAFSVVGSYLGVRANATAAKQQREDDDRRVRDAYQVETLQELQMALQRLMRAVGAIQSADLAHHRRTGEPWGKQPVSEPLNTEALRSAIVVRLLVVRVLDDDVRQQVEDAHGVISIAWHVESEAESKRRMEAAGEAFSKAQHRIGQALRALPAPGSYRPLVTSPLAEETPEQPPLGP